MRSARRGLTRSRDAGDMPELMPLAELLGGLMANLRELRPRYRLAEGLRQLADAIERTKVH